jgi:hypothetical protein
MTETGFAEKFNASHRMGPALILLKISARTALSKTYRMVPMSTRLISHWSIPLIAGEFFLLDPMGRGGGEEGGTLGLFTV